MSPTNPAVDVSVIVVSFNTCSLLRDCLRSVYEKTEGVSFEVIVSDNGSTDGSVEMVRKEFPQVRLVENNANLGFGTANNRGLDVACGKFIFYLNSDTLLNNNAIKFFCDFWKAHESENLGALGCNLVDAEGKWTESHNKFPRGQEILKAGLHHMAAFYVKNVMKLLHLDFSKLRPVPRYERFVGNVDYVVGADLFVKNTPDARFDEKFFLYYEETDMQWRMAKKGLKRTIIDGPSVVHLIRGGRGKQDDVVRYGSFSMIQSEISKVYYAKKNISRFMPFFLKPMIFAQWLSPYIFKSTRKHFKSLWSV
jgi:GT2 family glycosyltransferase